MLDLYVWDAASGGKVPVVVSAATEQDMAATKGWQTSWRQRLPNKVALRRTDVGELVGRISAMQRRNKMAETKQLASALLLVRKEGIQSMEDFAPRQENLRHKLESLQSSIEAIRARNAAYKTAARYLVTYHTYLPVKLESMKLSGWDRKKFERTHEVRT